MRLLAGIALWVIMLPAARAQPGIEGTLGQSSTIIKRLDERGITLDISIIGDYSMVLEGGVNQRAIADRVLTQAGVILDTEKSIGLPGGTFTINYLGLHGENGSLDTGDVQAYSNIDAEPFNALYSLWYQQNFLDDRLQIKFGKMDANADFAYVLNGTAFLNSSPGFSPTIRGFPSYPDPATGVELFWRDMNGIYGGVGVFDGASQNGLATGTRGPERFFGKPSATFYIAEVGTHYMIGQEPGRIGVGLWHHSGRFTTFDTGENQTANGSYLVLDQGVYSDPDSMTAIDVYFQYAKTDDAVSPYDTHVSGGAEIKGLLAGRPKDVSGVMASYVGFSDAPGTNFVADYELTVEGFYGIRPIPWFEIKPDIQYIINPGGNGTDDALVGTLRGRVAF